MGDDLLIANVVGTFIKGLVTEDTAKYSLKDNYMPYFDEGHLPLLETADDEDEKFFKRHFLQEQQRLTLRSSTKRLRSECSSLDSGSSDLNMRNRGKRARVELNLLNRFKPAVFENNLHMHKMTFLRIFQALRDMLPDEAFPTVITPQNAFSLSLWKLTTDEHFEQIANKFDIPLSVCHATIKRFWHLVSDNYERFLEWPKSPEAQESMLHDFRSQAQLRRFPDIFGVIAIKNLNIFLENLDTEVAAVLQVVCNVDQRIIDCYVELEQNYTFETSPLGQTLARGQQAMPPNAYLVGDITFPLKAYLVRPFENVCSKQERYFNTLLTPALKLGQQTLDTLTQRFNTLYALEAKNLQEVRKIVETVCVLHNLCVDVEDDFVERATRDGKLNLGAVSTSTSVQLERLSASESNVEGLRRRYELLDVVVGATA